MSFTSSAGGSVRGKAADQLNQLIEKRNNINENPLGLNDSQSSSVSGRTGKQFRWKGLNNRIANEAASYVPERKQTFEERRQEAYKNHKKGIKNIKDREESLHNETKIHLENIKRTIEDINEQEKEEKTNQLKLNRQERDDFKEFRKSLTKELEKEAITEELRDVLNERIGKLIRWTLLVPSKDAFQKKIVTIKKILNKNNASNNELNLNNNNNLKNIELLECLKTEKSLNGLLIREIEHDSYFFELLLSAKEFFFYLIIKEEKFKEMKDIDDFSKFFHGFPSNLNNNFLEETYNFFKGNMLKNFLETTFTDTEQKEKFMSYQVLNDFINLSIELVIAKKDKMNKEDKKSWIKLENNENLQKEEYLKELSNCFTLQEERKLVVEELKKKTTQPVFLNLAKLVFEITNKEIIYSGSSKERADGYNREKRKKSISLYFKFMLFVVSNEKIRNFFTKEVEKRLEQKLNNFLRECLNENIEENKQVVVELKTIIKL